MTMIAFTALVIETDQSLTGFQKNESVFERMSAGSNGLVDAPHHHLNYDSVVLFTSFSKYERRLHRWQYRQHPSER